LFVVFEGIDGVGKTTIIEGVHEELVKSGIKTQIMKTPTEYLRNGSMWKVWTEQKVGLDDLFGYGLSIMAFGERISYQQHTILPALENKIIVLLDRYILSSLVYESGIIHQELSKLLITPDCKYVLDADISVVIKRISERKYEELCDGEELLLTNLKEKYLLLGALNGYEKIDTSYTSPQIHINSIVNQIIKMYSNKNK